MPDRVVAISRRHLLGAGAAAGAASLVSIPVASAATAAAASAAGPVAVPRAAAPATSSIFYPGIQLTSGHPAGTCGLQFIAYDAQGAYPSVSGGYVGTPLALPAGSYVGQVVFFLYQTDGQQRCDVQIFNPGAPGLPVVASEAVTGTGIIAQAFALDHTLTAGEAIAAFVWGGGWATGNHSVCRGIRVDYSSTGGLGASSGGGGFVPIVPARVYDSRSNGGPISNAQERTVPLTMSLTGQPVVPPGARAAALTVTVTETTGSGGYVAVFPAGTPWPSTSSVNWFGPDQNLATALLCAVDGAARVTVRGGVNPTQVVIDVTGYFV